MKNSSNELWKTTYLWLLQCGNKVNRNFCKEEITTHPDYPALTSLIDFLDSGRMEYKAVIVDASYIYELNYPLLAHIKEPGQEYLYLINNTTVWDEKKEITQFWSGITVYPEKNTQWKNNQNDDYQLNSLKNRIYSFILLSIIFALFSASIFHNPNILNNLFGLFSLLGLIISIFLLGTELGFESQIVKQFCGTVSNGGCEKVLKSNYAKGVAGVTLADASLLYFVTQFILYLLCAWLPDFLNSLILLAFSGFFIAVWSIYIQTVELKQYCALCLCIVALLILQGVFSIFIFKQAIIFDLNYNIYIGLIFFISLFSVFALILLPIKNLLKTNYSNKIKLTELKKWKLDVDLFISQLKLQQNVDTTIWENDLLLGNHSAPLLITVACNLYCRPCAKVHAQLDNLLILHANKLKVQVRLLFDFNNQNDNRTVASKAILQKIVENNENNDLQEILTDWFVWMDFNKWKNKWNPDEKIDVGNSLLKHKTWIEESDIAYTPTLFLNGKKLPGRYSLEDIEMLLPQLTSIDSQSLN